MTAPSPPASSPARLDATHAFNVGMASPLTVAVGVEAREDTYAIGAGEPLSYYKEGPQSFPGFPIASCRQPQPQELCGLCRLRAGADRGPPARCRGPRRTLHRLRRHPDRQDHGPLRLQSAMGGPRHHLDRLPRSDPGGRILHRRQRLAGRGHRAAPGQLRRRPSFWALPNLKPETSTSYSVPASSPIRWRISA